LIIKTNWLQSLLCSGQGFKMRFQLQYGKNTLMRQLRFILRLLQPAG